MDNPFWPNMSAAEKAKDAAAKLPPPKVSGAEWILSEHDIKCIAAGAGILASGGGGDPNYGYDKAKQILDKGMTIKIVNPCRWVAVWHLCVNQDEPILYTLKSWRWEDGSGLHSCTHGWSYGIKAR